LSAYVVGEALDEFYFIAGGTFINYSVSDFALWFAYEGESEITNKLSIDIKFK
jgi:hypothetical protein